MLLFLECIYKLGNFYKLIEGTNASFVEKCSEDSVIEVLESIAKNETYSDTSSSMAVDSQASTKILEIVYSKALNVS